MKLLKKWSRRIQLHLLSRATPEQLLNAGEKRLIKAFKVCATKSRAYAALLAEHQVSLSEINDIKSFERHCPLLNKDNTFERFPLHELCLPDALDSLASVITSSGHSGRYAYGLTSRKQHESANDLIDLGLEQSFQVDRYKTLLINCLPMGVGFGSNTVTIAATSVREDMAVALADKLGPHYDQVILLGDPLFFKRLADYSKEKGMDWSRMRTHMVIGEEPFGEHYRDYLAKQFKINPETPEQGFIGSSMGAGELGLNIFFETTYTIELRRLAHRNPALFHSLFGLNPDNDPMPMLFAYNPLRSHVETLNTDGNHFGELTISMTDTEAPLPLLRYQTGDIARLLTHDRIDTALTACGCAPLNQPRAAFPLIAITGRDKEELPDGFNVNRFKDGLYADPHLADDISGAFRIEYDDHKIHLHIQARRGARLPAEARERFARNLPGALSPEQITLHDFDSFPFGMNLDYERKFTYYAT